MTKIKYGILSTAQIARNHHFPSAKNASNSEFVAISSRSYTRAEKYGKELGIEKVYGSYEELLEDPDIDAVLNPLPNSMHAEWTIKAARAGKHILCEKPFAVTVEEARKMARAAEENNVILMEGFTHRFKPEVKFIKKLIASKKMGMVKTIYSDLVYNLGEAWATDSRAKKDLAGGSLMDCGCYCISLIRYILGIEPSFVQGMKVIHMPNEVDGTFHGSLYFENGILAIFFSSMEMPFRATLEITTEKGRISLDNFFTGNKVRYIINGDEKEKKFEEKERFTMQIEHFSDCILNSKKPEFTPADAIKNTIVIESLRKSAQHGNRITLYNDLI